MHSSIFLTIMALCSLALAAPPARLPFPHSRPIFGRQNDSNTPGAPACDLNNIAQPTNTLTPPQPSMRLLLVALGQGTQNYTCASPTSTPSSFGALATLFDASCLLSSNPAAKAPDSPSIAKAAPIGQHFFVDSTTPAFAFSALGNTQMKKVEDMPAPNAAQDVRWLRLQAQTAGSSSEVKEVYRLNTAGGLAPPSCEGRAVGETVTVKYEAQYWVYA